VGALIKTVQFHVVVFPTETITVNIGAEQAWKILIGKCCTSPNSEFTLFPWPWAGFEWQGHGLINYTDTKAKCRHLNKLICKGTLRQVFICLRPLHLLSFVGLNLVIYRVLTPTEYGLQQDSTPLTPSQPNTVCIYCTLTQRKGGELNQREG
jgi:hypothetical protein